jgi:mRNA interferase MazF
MASWSRHDVVLVRYPFSDLSGAKVRPAVVVSAAHPSQDLLITPLTSRTTGLMPGEFMLAEWARSGLHVPTAAKRGVYTFIHRWSRRGLGAFGRLTANNWTRP